MNAKITYRMDYRPHPWNQKLRAEGTKAWCLVKVTTPEMGPQNEESVAMFNFDSEGELFQGHVLASGLDGKLIDIDPDVRSLFELREKNRRQR